jgi:hypothetical protein
MEDTENTDTANKQNTNQQLLKKFDNAGVFTDDEAKNRVIIRSTGENTYKIITEDEYKENSTDAFVMKITDDNQCFVLENSTSGGKSRKKKKRNQKRRVFKSRSKK